MKWFVTFQLVEHFNLKIWYEHDTATCSFFHLFTHTELAQAHSDVGLFCFIYMYFTCERTNVRVNTLTAHGLHS